MPLILGTNSIKDTGYDVANSLRFNDGSSDNLSLSSLGTATNNKKQTLSFWCKRSTIGSVQRLFVTNGLADPYFQFFFQSNDKLRWQTYEGSVGSVSNFITTRVFRDTSAWYHFHLVYDTTQSTSTDRAALYVNGVKETAYDTEVYPSLNSTTEFDNPTLYIGQSGNSDGYFDGYLAEFVVLDGQSITPDGNTGEFDSDSPTIWKPIDVSGLTFGNNGFYLDFENASSLGADVSGNGNNFTVNNLTSIDQTTDTCTNNFAVLNPLHQIGSNETSQGNLEYSVSNHHRIISTIAPTSGKWYAEVQGVDSPNKFMAGVAHYPMPANGSISSFAFGMGVNADVGRFANDFGVRANGDYGNNNSYVSFMSTPSNNDIIGIYMDLDNYKLYMSLNGSLVSSTGKDLTNNGEPYGFISVGEAGTFKWNFGNPSFTVSSGNTDDEGFGNFEFSPNITGDGASKSFFALCTKNLAEYG